MHYAAMYAFTFAKGNILKLETSHVNNTRHNADLLQFI